MPNNISLNCDCLEYMKSLPDKYFDLCVADPPYGDASSQNVQVEREREREPWNRFGGRFDRYKTATAPLPRRGQMEQVPCPQSNRSLAQQQTPAREREGDGDAHGRDLGGEVRKKIIAWDVAPEKEVFDEIFRVSRNQIIFGGNYFALPPTRCFLVWRKLTISESFSMAMAEYAWTSFNANAKVFECAPQGNPGDPRFHPCLPKGTKVFFSGEWKNIEKVEIGERNEFGAVSAITTHDAMKMVEISSNGKTITATWNHPFLVKRGNSVYWVNADQLKKGDELLRLKKNTHSHAKGIIGTERTEKGCGWNIALFGKNIMEKSRKVCKSITKTLTRQITILPTCFLLRPLNTSGCTKVADLKTVFGISRAKSVGNTRPQPRKTGIFLADGLTGELAKSVTSRNRLKIAVCALQTVGSVKIINEKTEVYNLSLDGIPAFETEIGITHNTQKPIELYAWIYKLFAKPGDKIFDPFLGSGSSRIAAYDAGLDFTGCEIDEYYYRMQEERFERHTAQLSLFV